MHIAIIGAGWSGLTLAYLLANKKDISTISIFEASSICGGRARTFKYKQFYLDNGQHIMVGAYHNMLTMLNLLGQDIQQIFNIYNMQWHNLNGFCLKDINIPFLLQNPQVKLLFSVVFAPRLSIKDKILFIKIMHKLAKNNYKIEASILTVQDWLCKIKMPLILQKDFFYPLCLSALNTHASQACIKRFMATLHITLGSNNKLNSKLLIPKISLNDLYIKPITKYLFNSVNTIIYTNTLVKNIHLNLQHKWQITSNKQLLNSNIEFDKIIIATNYYNAQNILKNSHNLGINIDFDKILPKIEYLPITTLYVQTKALIAKNKPFLVYDEAIIFQKDNNLWAIVFSTKDIDNESILKLLIDYQTQFKHEFKLIKKICEKKATYACTPFHPYIHNKIDDNLYLCGDYLHSEYPATLEAAISSAFSIANEIMLNL